MTKRLSREEIERRLLVTSVEMTRFATERLLCLLSVSPQAGRS